MKSCRKIIISSMISVAFFMLLLGGFQYAVAYPIEDPGGSAPITRSVELNCPYIQYHTIDGFANAWCEIDLANDRIHVQAITMGIGGAQVTGSIYGYFIAPATTTYSMQAIVKVLGNVGSWGPLAHSEIRLSWKLTDAYSGAVIGEATIFYASAAGWTFFGIPIPDVKTFNHREYPTMGFNLEQGREYKINFSAFAGVGSLAGIKAESDFMYVDFNTRYFDIESLSYTYTP